MNWKVEYSFGCREGDRARPHDTRNVLPPSAIIEGVNHLKKGVKS